MYEERAMSMLGIAMETEQVMFLLIGLLLGGLLALAVLPLIHRRAVRRAMHRIEATAPVSMKEIQSDKDALRADFAVSTQRLEGNIAELRNKTSAHFAELAKKSTLIDRLSAQLAERAARIEALEARERMLEARERSSFEQLEACKVEIGRLADALTQAELARADLALESHRLAGALQNRTRQVDNQDVAILTLQNQVDTVCLRVFELANIVRECDSRGALDRADFSIAARGDDGGRANGTAFINAVMAAE
jgi:predicted  nucleic acid-binding Zn-ribbon protein